MRHDQYGYIDIVTEDSTNRDIVTENFTTHQGSSRRHRTPLTYQQVQFLRNIICTFPRRSTSEMRDIALAILNGTGRNYFEQIRRRFPETEVPLELLERRRDIYGYIYNRCRRKISIF